MIFDKRKPNKIINIAVLAALCAVVFYCIGYIRENMGEPQKSDEYHVSIRGEEPAEEKDEGSDPYEGDFLPVSVMAECGGFAKEVSLYVSEGVCYAFLPAYADLARASWVFDNQTCEVKFNGEKVAAGGMLQSIENGADYAIDIKDGMQNELHYQIVFMQSAELPSVFIDTQSGSMDYVDVDKGNEESGRFYCITAEGEIDSQGVMERIRGRGNTSWEGPGGKNQYNVRLAESTDVLHMGSSQNWIVQANKLDVSMLRNKLAYDFAKDIGIPYAVDCEFADLYLNNRYMGTYLVCEKVEVAENRVGAQDGYLLEANFRAIDSETVVSTSRGTFVINYPEEVTQETHDYIADYVGKVAESLTSARQSERYLDYIDLSSFATLFIVDEVGNDPDNNALSTFYYKEDRTDDSKLTAGPIWDFDIALGNDERCAEVLNSYYGEGWFEYLYKSETFREEVSRQLQEIMDTLYDKYENRYFKEMVEYMEASYRMNEVRWKEKQGYIASYYPDFQGTVQYLDDYFMARLKNLHYVFNGPDRIHKVEFLDRGRQYAHTYVKDGDVIPVRVLENLQRVDGVDSYSLDNEQVIDPYSYVVYSDVRINCRQGGNSQPGFRTEGDVEDAWQAGGQDIDKGELAMQWISFIMLMVPGLVSVWLSGNNKVTKDAAFGILVQYLLNSFLILLISYGVFYVTYGSAVLSFSDIYSESYDYSIYNINVAFKYLMLAGGLSVAVGIIERIMKTLLCRKRTKSED